NIIRWQPFVVGFPRTWPKGPRFCDMPERAGGGRQKMRGAGRIIAAGIAVTASIVPQAARAVTTNGVTLTNPFLIRDDRSINDAGLTPGFELSFGGDISGGSSGYTGAGIFTHSERPHRRSSRPRLLAHRHSWTRTFVGELLLLAPAN